MHDDVIDRLRICEKTKNKKVPMECVVKRWRRKIYEWNIPLLYPATLFCSLTFLFFYFLLFFFLQSFTSSSSLSSSKLSLPSTFSVCQDDDPIGQLRRTRPSPTSIAFSHFFSHSSTLSLVHPLNPFVTRQIHQGGRAITDRHGKDFLA